MTDEKAPSEVERANGFRLSNVQIAKATTEEGDDGFLLKFIFKTSPLIQPVRERDINMSLLAGTRPSEMAQGLMLLAQSVLDDLPDDPEFMISPETDKSMN